MPFSNDMASLPRRNLLTVLTIALSLSACSASPSPAPTTDSPVSIASPSPRPPYARPTIPPQGAAKCQTDDETSYTAVGWLGRRIEVLASHFVYCDAFIRLLSVDPSSGAWQIDLGPSLDLAQAISDGHTILIPSDSGTSLLFPSGAIRKVVPPERLTGDWGYKPTSYGGYLAVGYGATSVIRLGVDGRWLVGESVPKGDVVLAPTSDAEHVILARREDAESPYAFSKGLPYTAYLFDVRTRAVTRISTSVAYVESSSASSAYIVLANGQRFSLASNGRLTPADLGGDDPFRSPTGAAYLDVPDSGSESSQSIALRSSGTGHVIATYVGSYGVPAWSGSTAAFVPRDPSSANVLVIMGERGTSTVPLPSNLTPPESPAP